MDQSHMSQQAEQPINQPEHRRTIPCWPALASILVFLLAALPLILTRYERGRGAFDQINYHEPAILRFAQQWPRPDLSDYLSATTPGYHLVLAAVARFASESTVPIRLVGALFTVALLWVLSRWLTARVGPAQAFLLTLCVGSSMYVFAAGVFILPDNAAWLGVLGVVLLALRPRFDRILLIGGGAALLALVLTRQSHLWAASALWTAAWLGPAVAATPTARAEITGLLTDPGVRVRRTLLMLAATLPALLAVAWFVRLWGGLTVPIYHDYMTGTNPATPAFVLAQVGVIAVFLAGFWLPAGLRLLRERPVILGLVLAASLATVLIPQTTYSIDDGRYSGLWNAVRRLPAIAGHTSVLLLALTPLGAIALASWLAGVGPRSRWIMLASLAGFVAAVTMTLNAWQRYHEPMLLLSTVLLSALCVSREPRTVVRPVVTAMRLAGPATLAAVLAALTAMTFVRAGPVGPPMETQDTIERPLRELWPQRWPRIEQQPPAASMPD
jgi:hypothetical protein